MRLVIIILLFSLSANGQIINGSPAYRVIVSACPTLLLDSYSNSMAAYSLRKLTTGYAGSAIRVRRSSDNTEQNIGFLGCGDFDTVSLKAFVGTGGTDDGFVVTWYDQSGNTRDVTQATAGSQPIIMDNGVVIRKDTKPAIYFVGANNTILRASFTGFSVTSLSTFAVFYTTSVKSSARVTSIRPSGTHDYQNYAPILANGTSTTAFGAYVSAGYRASVTVSNSVLNIYGAIHTGATIQNSVNNGTDATSSHTLSVTPVVLTIGASALTTNVNNDGNITGFVSEVVYWASDQSGNKAGIYSNINSYYSAY